MCGTSVTDTIQIYMNARVSTKQQDLMRQLDLLSKYNAPKY